MCQVTSQFCIQAVGGSVEPSFSSQFKAARDGDRAQGGRDEIWLKETLMDNLIKASRLLIP